MRKPVDIEHLVRNVAGAELGRHIAAVEVVLRELAVKVGRAVLHTVRTEAHGIHGSLRGIAWAVWRKEHHAVCGEQCRRGAAVSRDRAIDRPSAVWIASHDQTGHNSLVPW